ncbi:MAG: ABC transporter permease, partial [Terriglobales bacterium]
MVWRPLRQFPARALVSLLAVALGIAVVIGIRLASRAATQSFAATSRALAGSADLLVRGPAAIPAAMLARLNFLGGEARILPYINRIAYDPNARDTLELYGASLPALPTGARFGGGRGDKRRIALLGDRSGSVEYFPVHSIRPRSPRRAPLASRPARASRSKQGNAPRNSAALPLGSAVPSPGDRLAGCCRQTGRPAAVPLLLAAAYARQHDDHPGQILALVVGTRRLRFRIAGLLPDRGWARAQAGHIAVLDVGALAALLDPGVPPRFDGLSISLAPGVSAAAIARQIQPLIPAGDSVQPPASRQRQADKMLAAFQDNLLALSFVALLVGAFLIYQTMTMAVLRRRSAIAVVRALGAPARTVRAVMLTEAAAVGTLGALAGLGIGWLFARAAVRGLSATVNNLYAVSHPEPLRLTPADLALA